MEKNNNNFGENFWDMTNGEAGKFSAKNPKNRDPFENDTEETVTEI